MDLANFWTRAPLIPQNTCILRICKINNSLTVTIFLLKNSANICTQFKTTQVILIMRIYHSLLWTNALLITLITSCYLFQLSLPEANVWKPCEIVCEKKKKGLFHTLFIWLSHMFHIFFHRHVKFYCVKGVWKACERYMKKYVKPCHFFHILFHIQFHTL